MIGCNSKMIALGSAVSSYQRCLIMV